MARSRRKPEPGPPIGRILATAFVILIVFSLVVRYGARLRDLVSSYNGLPYGPGVMGQSWVNSAQGCGCFAGFYQAYLTADGELTPCDFTPISFGNVRQHSLHELWRRMRASPEWKVRFGECRMQDPEFRKNSIEPIPDDEPLPVRYERLQELRRARGGAG